MCGFKRPALSTAQPLSVVSDIYEIDGCLIQLRGIALSSAYAKHRRMSSPPFCVLCLGPRLFFQLLLKMFVDFLLRKIPEGKHKSMFPLVLA